MKLTKIAEVITYEFTGNNKLLKIEHNNDTITFRSDKRLNISNFIHANIGKLDTFDINGKHEIAINIAENIKKNIEITDSFIKEMRQLLI